MKFTTAFLALVATAIPVIALPAAEPVELVERDAAPVELEKRDNTVYVCSGE